MINESDEKELIEMFYDDDVCLMDVSVIDEIIEKLEALKELMTSSINCSRPKLHLVYVPVDYDTRQD